MLTNKSFFHFKEFKVYQGNAGLKVNTDGVLLGALASQRHPESILDIGTGTGLIGAIIANRYHKAKHIWLDINEDAVSAAIQTKKHHPQKARIEIILKDFRSYQSNQKFDLIVSNPPYFKAHTASNMNRKIARQQEFLDFDNLLQKSASLLTDNGSLWLVLPANTFEEIQFLGMQNKLYIQSKISIADTPNSEAKRIILALIKDIKPIKTSNLYLFNENGTAHAHFYNLCKDLYVKFPQR
ncbi:tRNA1(Val) (adenine(37)-N6)-methyltransferase [Luteibaculum oceani]|uniref:Methyltransferase n=1 Tax=Luteibaculum oceani TaxID=1294296 RepID=A0A5C6V9S4_9FLAO|nr:methyltransferase [Luteibaculum oceani]TXC81464.1 methyltransferase [Luteibaculum oceani]